MELKTYITLFILGNIINLLCKRSNVLACGLWGFCGASAPEPWKLAMLAIINLKRGEHATGYFADGEIHKATEPAPAFLGKNYHEFQALAEIKNFVVIGHDRQASVGSKDNLEQAHPHGVKEGEKFKFVLAHNGTITNGYHMSEHYHVPHVYSQHSDSQLLTKIMAGLDKETLLEPLRRYEGTATVVFTFPRYKHIVYVHRDPLREIFYYQESPDRLYWSSIKESLFVIGGTEETIGEFKPYEVCQINKGKITKTWSTADRDPLVYKAPTKKNTGPATGTVAFNNWAANDDLAKKQKDGGSNNGLVFANHRYFLNGHRVTGTLHLNGINHTFSKQPFQGSVEHFFVDGLMARDRECYNTLFDMGMKDGAFDPKKFSNANAVLVCEYTKFPVFVGVHIARGTLLWIGKYQHQNYNVNGTTNITFCPPFSPYIYTLNSNGILMEHKELKDFQPAKEAPSTPRGSIDNITEALQECLKTEHTDFSTLYDSVRYSMAQKDEAKFYDEVVSTFIFICEQTGAIEEDYTIDFKNVAHFDQEKYEDLNTMLKLYYAVVPSEDEEYDLEAQVKQLQKDNLWSHSNTFREDLDTVKYDSLDIFLAAYCDTDEDEVTKPVLIGVALELLRLGAMTELQVVEIQDMKPPDMQRHLNRYYEIYAVNEHVDKGECTNSCVADPTSTIANMYLRGADLKLIPVDKITDAEKQELQMIKDNIKLLIEKHEKMISIDSDRLRTKHGLELHVIKSIYE